jgi:hypothetical protein
MRNPSDDKTSPCIRRSGASNASLNPILKVSNIKESLPPILATHYTITTLLRPSPTSARVEEIGQRSRFPLSTESLLIIILVGGAGVEKAVKTEHHYSGCCGRHLQAPSGRPVDQINFLASLKLGWSSKQQADFNRRPQHPMHIIPCSSC